VLAVVVFVLVNLTFSSANTQTIYVYDSNEKQIAVVTAKRSGNSWWGYSYTATLDIDGGSEDAALAMWSSGRVDGNNYEFYWFGPMRGRLDGWLSGFSPSYSYNESREHYEIGYAPYGMNGIQDMATGASVTNADRGAATVARCIREYDNVATANE